MKKASRRKPKSCSPSITTHGTPKPRSWRWNKPFQFDLQEYLPEYPDLPLFKGVIDSVVSVGGSVVVVDLKTSSKRLSKFQVDNNDQLTAYSMGAESSGIRAGQVPP